MVGYIYYIINTVNGKRYVGETIQYEIRQKTHLRLLKQGKHHSEKLQRAWNKYGEDAFIFQKESYEITNLDELLKLEQQKIKEYNSYFDGYNMTIGGEGAIRKNFTFDQYCIIRAGNEKFEAMIVKTANYFNVDKTVISDIIKIRTYQDFSDQYEILNQDSKDKYINTFIEIFNIDVNNPPKLRNKLKVDYLVLAYCLCVLNKYEDIGKSLEEKLQYAKGTISRLKLKKGYLQAWQIFDKWTDEEKDSFAEKYYEEWNLKEVYIKRQTRQGGSAQSYTLNQNDFNHIFKALEIGITKKEIAEFVKVKECTVFDWNSHRSRKKEYEVYQSLPQKEKDKLSWPY